MEVQICPTSLPKGGQFNVASLNDLPDDFSLGLRESYRGITRPWQDGKNRSLVNNLPNWGQSIRISGS